MILLLEKEKSKIYGELEEEEILKYERELVQASKKAKKYVFCIKYGGTEKIEVLSEINRLQCGILEESDSESCVTVRASMTQLAVIRSRDFVKTVELVEETTASGNELLRKTGKDDIVKAEVDSAGKYGLCTSKVENAVSVESITMACNTYDMCVGQTAYIDYVIYPKTATNQSVIWCSSNTDVAEVDSATGRITAEMPGTVFITVTTLDGCFVDSSTLVVSIPDRSEPLL